MTMFDGCPWCNSPKKIEAFQSTTTHWTCGTSWGCAHPTRSEECKRRERAKSDNRSDRTNSGNR